MTPPIRMVSVPVDELAQEIRRVDGNHSLGAGALAEALLPFLSRFTAAPVREEGGAASDAMVEAACSRFVSESDDIWSASVWPEGPDDDGDRGDGGRVRLISEADQHNIRSAMRFALTDALAAEAGEACGHQPGCDCTVAEEDVARSKPPLRAQPQAREEAQPVWVDGLPSKHHAQEWFIAETTFGERVVLTALPEEYAYDFKTADETYIKADRIKRWMPFPDSQYLFPTQPAPEAEKLREAAALLDECIWTDHDTGDYRVEHDGSVEKARAILAALQQDALSAAPGEAGE